MKIEERAQTFDCISFSMMEAFRIGEAFGFGKHFTRYGFRLLPG